MKPTLSPGGSLVFNNPESTSEKKTVSLVPLLAEISGSGEITASHALTFRDMIPNIPYRFEAFLGGDVPLSTNPAVSFELASPNLYQRSVVITTDNSGTVTTQSQGAFSLLNELIASAGGWSLRCDAVISISAEEDVTLTLVVSSSGLGVGENTYSGYVLLTPLR